MSRTFKRKNVYCNYGKHTNRVSNGKAYFVHHLSIEELAIEKLSRYISFYRRKVTIGENLEETKAELKRDLKYAMRRHHSSSRALKEHSNWLRRHNEKQDLIKVFKDPEHFEAVPFKGDGELKKLIWCYD